jgi:hypothetical protein
MRAATAVVAFLMVSPVAASPDPQPTKVDIAPFRADLLVFVDAAGNTYVLKPATPNKTPNDARLFFAAPGKPAYEQMVIGRSANGPAWALNTWAPRIPGIRPAYFEKQADGSFRKLCADPDHATPLTQLTGDKAKQALDKTQVMTEFLVRRPHMFARDDTGTYYYVDRISQKYGGKGYRVFVGKKGAMKQMPLTDVATDVEGEVFATKSGDIRIDNRSKKSQAYFVRGEKKVELITLDTDANSAVIFTDLGIYQFLGTLCDTW